MDEMTSDSRIRHSNFSIDLFDRPRLTNGKIGMALNLDGGSQYASIGSQYASCLGNLDFCRHGFLFSAWLRPGQLQDGMDIMSTGSNGIRAWYQNGRLHMSVRTLTRDWTLSTDALKSDQWQFVEVRVVLRPPGKIDTLYQIS